MQDGRAFRAASKMLVNPQHLPGLHRISQSKSSCRGIGPVRRPPKLTGSAQECKKAAPRRGAQHIDDETKMAMRVLTLKPRKDTVIVSRFCKAKMIIAVANRRMVIK